MPKQIVELIENLKQQWSKLESQTKKRAVLFSVLAFIAIGIMATTLTSTEYKVLYTGLDSKENSEVLSLLEEIGVKAKTSEGGTILVEEKQEEYARMQLSIQGYPKSGLNYDLYLNSISMTSSTQDKNIVLIYQLQDRLRSTIKLLQGVLDAIVTISIDTDETFKFSDESSDVSANVVLDLEGNFTPSKQQVSAIKKLMLTSVAGLNAENLAIIDSKLNDLLPLSKDGSFTALTHSQQEFKNQIEEQIEDKILYLFEPVFGLNNFKVAASAELNFDKESAESISYTPVIDDEGIAVVIEELREVFEDSTTNIEAGSDSLNERVQNVVNYRVNEMSESIEKAEGNIENISVSILINNPELEVAQLEEIRRVAASAIGVELIDVNASIMNFSAYEDKQQEIAEAMALASLEDEGFAISEKAIVGIVAAVLAFAFGMIVFLSIRRSKKAELVKPTAAINQSSASREMLRAKSKEEMSSEVLADVLDKRKSLEVSERNKEEEIIRNEIEKIIDSNPKNIAEIVSYWLENNERNHSDRISGEIKNE